MKLTYFKGTSCTDMKLEIDTEKSGCKVKFN